jgi:hypothetical protein
MTAALLNSEQFNTTESFGDARSKVDTEPRPSGAVSPEELFHNLCRFLSYPDRL